MHVFYIHIEETEGRIACGYKIRAEDLQRKRETLHFCIHWFDEQALQW